MQVVGSDAIPRPFWEGPTERIIERRNWERRQRRRADDMTAPPAVASASRKKLVIGVSLATFACGALAAVAYDRLRSPARAARIAPIARALPPAPAPAASKPMIVAPTSDPEPAVAPARVASVPAIAPPNDEKRLARPKARPATRSPVARAARPRRPAAPAARVAATAAAPEAPAAKPRPTKKWVDPFAD